MKYQVRFRFAFLMNITAVIEAVTFYLYDYDARDE